jgi:hypothetical protein
MKDKKRIFYLLSALLALVPLGLISDAPAWGEWESEHYRQVLGYVPEGIKQGKFLPSLIPDYSVEGVSGIVAYYISAITGVALIFGFFYILMKVKKRAKSS